MHSGKYLPNSVTKHGQTRKFTELPHIILHEFFQILHAPTYKNVKFIAQKTGHLYLGTTYPHREVDNSPTPGTKISREHPRGLPRDKLTPWCRGKQM